MSSGNLSWRGRRHLLVGAISGAICQPLADHTLERTRGPLAVVNSECDALIVTKIELGKVAMQMLLAAMLIDASHAALEDRIVALDGVRVDSTTRLISHVF